MTVSAAGVANPSGLVTLKLDGRTRSLAPKSKGIVTFTGVALPAGRNTVTIGYAGDSVTSARVVTTTLTLP